MKVLVCGSRTYKDQGKVDKTLDVLLRRRGLHTIIEGGQLGVDRLARYWAIRNRVHIITVLAEWQTFGKAAGPIRNRKMLRDYKPDLVVAFKGGRGTTNMIEQAHKAGVEVLEVNQ